MPIRIYAIYLFLITIILFFSYINSLHYQEIEGFTPRIREAYNSVFRKVHKKVSDFYEKQRLRTSNFLRKRGLM